jgi:hypothetical protein
MKQKLCEENAAAEEKLPPTFQDKSGIGVHYMSAYLAPMNTTLEDGTAVTCKRRGLRVALTVGDRKGAGLMRRIDVSEDPRVMLAAALNEAAEEAGVKLSIEDGVIYLDT